MYTLLVILIVLTALLMVGIVLIQESKGGGLTSQFADIKKLSSSYFQESGRHTWRRTISPKGGKDLI